MNEPQIDVDMNVDPLNDLEDTESYVPITVKAEAILDYMKKSGIFDRLRSALSNISARSERFCTSVGAGTAYALVEDQSQ